MANVAYRKEQVISTGETLIQKSKFMVRDITEVLKDCLMETTVNLTGLVDEQQRAVYKAAMTSIMQLQAEQEAYPEAMRELLASYAPSAQATDFAGAVKKNVQRVTTARSYDVSEDPVMKEFCIAIGEAPPTQAELGDDEDLQVTDGGAFPNEKCPLTAKSIFELREPVQDEKNFVYEKEAVLRHIQQHQAKRPGQPVPCPVAGASHYITAAGLRRAPSVAREKRKRDILEASQSQANGGAGPSRGNRKRTVLSLNEDDESEEVE